MKKIKTDNWLNRTKGYLLSSPHLLWFMLIAITAAFTVFQTPDRNKDSYSYQIGDVAQRDIKAPKNFFIEDKEVTAARKNQVKDVVKTVYDFDENLAGNISLRIETSMAYARQLFEKPEDSDAPDPTLAMALAVKPEFEKNLAWKSATGHSPFFINLNLHRISPKK